MLGIEHDRTGFLFIYYSSFIMRQKFFKLVDSVICVYLTCVGFGSNLNLEINLVVIQSAFLKEFLSVALICLTVQIIYCGFAMPCITHCVRVHNSDNLCFRISGCRIPRSSLVPSCVYLSPLYHWSVPASTHLNVFDSLRFVSDVTSVVPISKASL